MWKEIKQQFRQGKTLLTFTSLHGIGRILSMVAPLVVAKCLPAEMFGSYSLAIMIVFFFSMLLTVSPQTPFIVFASQEKTEKGKINSTFSVQLTFFVVSLFLFAAVTIPFHGSMARFAQIRSTDLLFVFLAFVGVSLKTFLGSLFMALDQRIRSAQAELVFGLLIVGFVGALYATDHIALQTVLLAYPAASVILVAVFLRQIDVRLLRPFVLEWKAFSDMLHFTKWVFLGATAVYFINWGDNFVLRRFASMDAIGNYNLGYQIFKGISTLTIGGSAYFLPFVNQHLHDTDKIRNYVFNKMRKLTALGAVLVGLVFILASTFFELIYQDAYPHAATVLRILLIGSVTILYTSLYKPVFDALKRYRFTHTVNVVQVLLNLLLDLLLVPSMGIEGAAVATVLACLVKLVAYEMYFRMKISPSMQLK